MEATLYTQEGKEKGKITLSEKVFGVKWSDDLVHQVVTSLASSSRTPIAHTKTRGEVSGGGRKPWRQKGTGRARHGSIRSPIWVGGGVTHGPRNEKKYTRKVNRVMKDKALAAILSRKFQEGEVAFIENLELKNSKTREAKVVLKSWKAIPGLGSLVDRRDNALIIAVPKKNESSVRSLRNFSNLSLEEVRNINPLSLLKYRGLVLVEPEESLLILYERLGVKVEPALKPTEVKRDAIKKPTTRPKKSK